MSPLLFYSTGAHFQSLIPRDSEFFLQLANNLGLKRSYEDGKQLSIKRQEKFRENKTELRKKPEIIRKKRKNGSEENADDNTEKKLAIDAERKRKDREHERAKKKHQVERRKMLKI